MSPRSSPGAAARCSSRSRCKPGAVYPEQTLGEELIVIVQDGSATVEFDGKTAELTKDHVLYLQPGAKRSVKAGPNGWKAFEVYSPVRLDHLALAGQNTSGVNATFPDQGVTPSLQPGVVVNLNEIPVDAVDRSRSGEILSAQHGALAAHLGQERTDQPGPHGSRLRVPAAHPSRRSVDAHGPRHPRSGRDGQVVPSLRRGGPHAFLPGGMVHSAKLGATGADQLDVFWPVRPDYVERAQKQQALYEQIVAPGAKPKKLADGFTFTEGPTWLKGKLYFSDMFFKNPAAGDWTGSPARSRLIVMEPDGKWRVLSSGMQSNGTMAAKNGNLIVCDMFGHRVVEVDPATGRVVRVVLDKIERQAD